MRLPRFIAVFALTCAACAPRVELADLDGRNARNNGFRIKIDRDAPCPRAIYAQELFEALEKRDPVQAVLIRTDSSERRSMEIASHEIEVQAAVRFCGAEADTHRRREAQAMHAGYDGLFSGSTPARIEARMAARADTARRWVERHADDISDLPTP